MSKVSKRTKASLYRKTAKAFENSDFKWIKSSLFKGGGRCAVGGLIHMAHKSGLLVSSNAEFLSYGDILKYRDIDTEAAVTRKLMAARGELNRVPSYNEDADVISFNDQFAKSKEDVVKHLRQTASALEHGGKL